MRIRWSHHGVVAAPAGGLRECIGGWLLVEHEDEFVKEQR